MARKIPPFAALRAFEATARLERQSEAADELGISTSAISHQIRALEAFLGVPLFERTASGLVLTRQGIAFNTRIASALDSISAATTEQMGTVDDTPLKLHMYQSLVNLWLIPNLKNLTEGLPDLRVSIVTQPETVNLSGSDIDAAIVYAHEKPATTFAEKLFDEVIVPVCSPDYLSRFGPIDTVDAVLRQPLIGSEHDATEWEDWAAACGVTFQQPQSSLKLDNRSNALQAAREGLGLAMDRRPFGDWQKSRGILVEPVPRRIVTGGAYYLVTTDRAHALQRVRKFRTWLIALCSKYEADDA